MNLTAPKSWVGSLPRKGNTPMTTATKAKTANTGRYIMGGVLGAPLIFVLTQAWIDSGKESQGAVITESAKDSEYMRAKFITTLENVAVNDGKVCASLDRVAIALERNIKSDEETADRLEAQCIKMDELIDTIQENYVN